MSLPPVPKIFSPLAANSPKSSLSSSTSRPRSQYHRSPPKDPPPPPPTQVNSSGSSLGRTYSSSLDAKLTILRREMAGLRQADVQLMGQLRHLQQSLQELGSSMVCSASVSPKHGDRCWRDSPSPHHHLLNGSSAAEDSGYSSYFSQHATQLDAIREGHHSYNYQQGAPSSSTSSMSSFSGDKMT